MSGIPVLFGRALCIASLTLIAGCGKSPESTVESFYHALGKGEVTEAQSYLSSRVVGMLGPQKLRSALEDVSQKIAKCGGIKSVTVKLEGQGEIRTGSSVVNYGGQCPARTEGVKLVKEDGKWKVDASK